MEEGTFWRELQQWLYGGTSLVSLGCGIAMLVVITTVVRRHRPDAYFGLRAWAIASLVVFVVMSIARIVLPRAVSMSSSDVEHYFKWSAMLTIVGTFLQLGLLALHIRGLVALAQPPKPLVVEGTAPYR